jgi:alanine racemase
LDEFKIIEGGRNLAKDATFGQASLMSLFDEDAGAPAEVDAAEAAAATAADTPATPAATQAATAAATTAAMPAGAAGTPASAAEAETAATAAEAETAATAAEAPAEAAAATAAATPAAAPMAAATPAAAPMAAAAEAATATAAEAPAATPAAMPAPTPAEPSSDSPASPPSINRYSFEDSLDATQRRWAWLEIDLEAIRKNVKAVRKHIGPDVMIMAVVKDDGYGHGAVEVAKAALASGARHLGVSTVAEGIALRRAGIDAPILVLSEPPMDTIPFLLRYNLATAVYSSEFALALGETADSQGRIASYHLKIDTGMNRVGVHHTDAADFLRSIDFHRGLELKGVFTHFATADEPDTFGLRTQLERFEEALETIRYMGIRPGTIHAANSAALIRFKETHFDMVRLGISLYGLHASDMTRDLIRLHPAMSVKARVICIKNVQVGEGVSYGFSYRSPGSVLIATVPIGYGDGLSRVLSNRMDYLVGGRAYPQVGTICMDLSMFEINLRGSSLMPRKEIKVGDEVVIVGRSGSLEISLDDVARVLGTISYDVACRFGLRLGKRYIG